MLSTKLSKAVLINFLDRHWNQLSRRVDVEITCSTRFLSEMRRANQLLSHFKLHYAKVASAHRPASISRTRRHWPTPSAAWWAPSARSPAPASAPAPAAPLRNSATPEMSIADSNASYTNINIDLFIFEYLK